MNPKLLELRTRCEIACHRIDRLAVAAIEERNASTNPPFSSENFKRALHELQESKCGDGRDLVDQGVSSVIAMIEAWPLPDLKGEVQGAHQKQMREEAPEKLIEEKNRLRKKCDGVISRAMGDKKAAG